MTPELAARFRRATIISRRLDVLRCAGSIINKPVNANFCSNLINQAMEKRDSFATSIDFSFL